MYFGQMELTDVTIISNTQLFLLYYEGFAVYSSYLLMQCIFIQSKSMSLKSGINLHILTKIKI